MYINKAGMDANTPRLHPTTKQSMVEKNDKKTMYPSSYFSHVHPNLEIKFSSNFP